MACRLDGAKPLSEQMLTYYQLGPKKHISINFYLKFKYFIQDVFEHVVCEMATVLSNGEMS